MRHIVGISALLALVVYMSCGAPDSEEANPFKTGAETIIEEKIAAESSTSSSSTSSSGSTSSSSGSSTSSTSSSSGGTSSSTSSSSGETSSSTSSSSSSSSSSSGGSSSSGSSGGGLGAQTSLVLSRVYGGGGAANTYANDFVEIFNPTTSAISLNGLTLQYGSATGDLGASQTGTFQNYAPLPNVTLAAGKYYLVALDDSATGTALPTPDLSVKTVAPYAINASGTNGKFALVNSTSGLVCGSSGTPCDSTKHGYIIDLVTYGTGVYYGATNLTTAAPALSSTKSGTRKNSGCTRSSPWNPNSDFEATDAPFTPRNTATNPVTCP